MSRKRKNLDRYSDLNTAAPVPLPPRPQFYTETSRSYEIRNDNGSMSMTQERRRVPTSPDKHSARLQNARSASPTPHTSSKEIQDLADGTSNVDAMSAHSDDAGTNSSQVPAGGSEGESEDESDEDEDLPRAARESVRPFDTVAPDVVYRRFN